MIAKASQRANGQQLAVHLLNAHDNEQVEVAEITGAIASDLPGAFAEWQALSRVTQCKKYLYSLSVNPDPAQGPLTRRQYGDYITRVEKKLGLAGQPRAIIFHIKDEREHCHVVWSRIIPDRLKAVPISHDRKSLQSVTRRFAIDHGRILPNNMRQGGNLKTTMPHRTASLHEKHQQERTGFSKEQRVQDITRLWQETNTATAFIAALEKAGYHLARGNRIPYVVVDCCGEIHSLPRQIEGARTRDICARLQDFPPEILPDAGTLKANMQAALKHDITARFNKSANDPWKDLRKSQDRRRAVLHKMLAVLKDIHKEERQKLVHGQKENLRTIREARLQKTAFGFGPILARMPIIKRFFINRDRKQDLVHLKEYRQERQELLSRQRADFEDLKRQNRSLRRVETREERSLKTRLRREFLQARITEKFQSAARAATPLPCPSPKETKRDSLTDAFAPTPVKNKTLRETFNRASEIPEEHDFPSHLRLDMNG
ncbi:MAG: relaxase/mobilization nuclease domain-containing protein [Candidatus Omnitrophota bacterium]